MQKSIIMPRVLIQFLMIAICLGAVLFIPGSATAGFAPKEDSFWVKLGYIHSRADEDYLGRHAQYFDSSVTLGERGEFRSLEGEAVGGTIRSHELSMSVVYSPLDRLVLELYAPLVRRLRYQNDRPFQTNSLGPGDPILAAGYQVTPRDWSRVAISIYLKGKIPTGGAYAFGNQATRSTGQFDTSAETRAGILLRDNLMLSGRILGRYRFAFRDGEDISSPGNELEFGLSVGGAPIERLWLSAGYGGLRAGPHYENFGPIQDATRMQPRWHTAQTGAYLKVGDFFGMATDALALDLFGSFVFAGQDYPRELSFGLGVAYSR